MTMMEEAGLNPAILRRTARKCMTEYRDGLVGLRHGWVEKMMSGRPEEKAEIYGNLTGQLEDMERFSEPYISAMRVVADAALRSLAGTSHAKCSVGREHLMEALEYEGVGWEFDERDLKASADGGLAAVTPGIPDSTYRGYRMVAEGFMILKDRLNLMEAATDPEVCRDARSTNDFPEARISKCFEGGEGRAGSAEEALGIVKEGYRLLSKSDELPRGDRRRAKETLRFLRRLELDSFTRGTQWYARLQFNEKPWSYAYRTALGATMLGVGGAAVTYFVTGDPVVSTLSGAAYTIGSGVGIYLATDAGPKTAKWVRSLGDRLVPVEFI